jgi:hypothetical protein
MEDIEAIMGLNVCNSEEEAKCKVEIGNEEYEQWACKNCEKKKPRSLHPWTQHLLRLRRLQKAGYPFSKNDLSYEEWLDLGILNELLK